MKRPPPSYALKGRVTPPMHSLETPTATFSYSSDLSGDIIVTQNVMAADPWKDEAMVRITWEDIRTFYLEMRRKQIISGVENASYDDLEAM